MKEVLITRIGKLEAKLDLMLPLLCKIDDVICGDEKYSSIGLIKRQV